MSEQSGNSDEVLGREVMASSRWLASGCLARSAKAIDGQYLVDPVKEEMDRIGIDVSDLREANTQVECTVPNCCQKATFGTERGVVFITGADGSCVLSRRDFVDEL